MKALYQSGRFASSEAAVTDNSLDKMRLRSEVTQPYSVEIYTQMADPGEIWGRCC